MSEPAIFHLKRDNASDWTANNPVLALAEPGYETDTRLLKIGDGSTAWNSLGYISIPAAALLALLLTVDGSGSGLDADLLDGNSSAAYVLASLIGAANGIAPLDSGTKIAAAYLPSYVDDVVEAANFAALPGTGETGKIYVTLDTNKTYRWGGSAYVEISPSPGTTDSLTEGSVNLYFTAARVLATLLTGLVDTSGTPASGDTLLAALGKIKKGFFTDHSGAGGGVHANVVAAGAAGFMTGSDKSKLDGVASGATANSSDAALLARANHTGTQLASTVSDFTEAAQDAVGSALTDTATIDLTYDDAGNAISADVKAGSITLAMQANMATASVVYRKTASAGPPEVQSLATLKTDLGLAGTNSGDQASIVGISGTRAQFNTANSDGDFVFTSDLGANVAALLAAFSSANLRAALTDETGTGSAMFATDPVFTGGTTNVLQSDVDFRNVMTLWGGGGAVAIAGFGGLTVTDWSSTLCTITSSGIAPVSTTTASAANVFQSASGAALLRSTSSEDFKLGIAPLDKDEAYRIVAALQSISFYSDPKKCVADDPKERRIGFGAKQAATVAPELAIMHDGAPVGLQIPAIVAAQHAVIQDLLARVTALEPKPKKDGGK